MENQPTDELEKEFGDLEVKLVDRMKDVYKENLKDYPAGVAVEIAANEGKDFRLYIDSNGRWSMRYQMSGFEIEENPNISSILDSYLFVTDALYRNLEPLDRQHYLQTGRRVFAENLLDKMRGTLAGLG